MSISKSCGVTTHLLHSRLTTSKDRHMPEIQNVGLHASYRRFLLQRILYQNIVCNNDSESLILQFRQ